VGDGSNDLCAVSMLKQVDLVFARQDYALAGLLKTSGSGINAKVMYSTTAEDILQQIEF